MFRCTFLWFAKAGVVTVPEGGGETGRTAPGAIRFISWLPPDRNRNDDDESILEDDVEQDDDASVRNVTETGVVVEDRAHLFVLMMA